MQLTICGHLRAVYLLSQNPNQDVIFISGPDNPYGIDGSEKIQGLAKDYCELLFHDISYPIGNLTPPARSHIEQALEFAKNRMNLIVACQAGISRSSATAFVIKAAEVGSTEALNILDPKIHMPNRIVIQHGSKILGDPDMVDIMDAWKNKSDECQINSKWEDWNCDKSIVS
jgi:predicted protein tyrosine phosphatase